TVDHTLAEVVVALDHEQGATHDRAVHGDQWQEDTQRAIEGRDVLVHDHFHDLYQRRDQADVTQQTEETQIRLGQTGPGQGAIAQYIGIQQVVRRNGDHLHHDHGNTQHQGSFDL